MLKYNMRAFSIDLRQRIVDALQSGQTRTKVSERFGVSLATVDRFAKLWREQKQLSPRPITGRPRAIQGPAQEVLQTLITTQKDVTLESLSKALEEQTGKKISLSALQRNLVWLGYSHKKSLASRLSETPRSVPLSWKR